MNKIPVPPFLNNLYRDMRDRRLLVPALALIVGLIAVPLALSSSSATTPLPPAAASSGSGHEAATSPAVLTEQPGVTNYRKRLEQIKSKNPFRLHFTSQPQGARSDPSSSAPTSSSATATTGSSTAISPTTSSTSSTPSSRRRRCRRPARQPRPHRLSPPSRPCTCSGSMSRLALPATFRAERASSRGSSCPARPSRWPPSSGLPRT